MSKTFPIIKKQLITLLQESNAPDDAKIFVQSGSGESWPAWTLKYDHYCNRLILTDQDISKSYYISEEHKNEELSELSIKIKEWINGPENRKSLEKIIDEANDSGERIEKFESDIRSI